MAQKILIVEDDEMISEMYRMKFEAAGYQVEICPDGEKAFDLAKNSQPDIILLDVMMPKISGYEVLKQIKTDLTTKKLKVYILSNLVQNGEVNEGFDAGADGYLVKSDLTPAQLVALVKKALAGEEIGVKKTEIPQLIKKNGVSINGNGQSENKEPDKKTVLIIEDEEAIIEMYQYRLEQDGYSVEVAKNGAWGVKKAKEKKYDVILMDMVMPAMNGYDAIKKLKQDGASKDSPIMVMSNSAQDKDVQEAVNCGAHCYLIKSAITPAKVASEVKKCLKNINKLN